MLGTAVCFVLLELLPVDFPYWVFALLLLVTGMCMASFGSPNRAGVMNSLPAQHRGAGSGMNTTFQNSAQVLSIGDLLHAHDRRAHRVAARPPAARTGRPRRARRRWPSGWPTCRRCRRCSPRSSATTRSSTSSGAHVLAQLTPAQQAALTGRSFFPGLIGGPFQAGLHAALDFAIVASLLAAWASWLRGGRYVYTEGDEADAEGDQQVGAAPPSGIRAVGRRAPTWPRPRPSGPTPRPCRDRRRGPRSTRPASCASASWPSAPG